MFTPRNYSGQKFPADAYDLPIGYPIFFSTFASIIYFATFLGSVSVVRKKNNDNVRVSGGSVHRESKQLI